MPFQRAVVVKLSQVNKRCQCITLVVPASAEDTDNFRLFSADLLGQPVFLTESALVTFMEFTLFNKTDSYEF